MKLESFLALQRPWWDVACIQLGSWNIFTSISCWIGTFRLPCNPMMCLLKTQVTWLPKKKLVSFSRVIPGFQVFFKPKEQQPMASQDLRWEQPCLPKSGDLWLPSITPRCHRVSSNRCLPWFQPSTALVNSPWNSNGIDSETCYA